LPEAATGRLVEVDFAAEDGVLFGYRRLLYMRLPVTAMPMFVINKLAAFDEPREDPNHSQIENVPIGVVSNGEPWVRLRPSCWGCDFAK
jgi:hypothetical protein